MKNFRLLTVDIKQKNVTLLSYINCRSMPTLHEQIKKEIDLGHLDEAMKMIKEGLQADSTDAYLHYLKGNLYMKSGDWRQATNCFLRSEELDPNSPAVEARKMLADIMNFYNKDLYNP